MAHIKHKHLFTVDAEGGWAGRVGETITVGNNRTICLHEDGVLVCMLHGHEVMHFDGERVCLFTNGYATATTRQAMNDFLAALAIPARVSFAGGEMIVTLGADVHRHPLDLPLTISI